MENAIYPRRVICTAVIGMYVTPSCRGALGENPFSSPCAQVEVSRKLFVISVCKGTILFDSRTNETESKAGKLVLKRQCHPYGYKLPIL